MAYDERGRFIPKDEETRVGSAIGNTIKVGSLVGAGALGWKYRSQIGRAGAKTVGITSSSISYLARKSGMSESIERWGRTLNAFAHATDQRGVASHLKNPDRFMQRFEARSLELIQDKQRYMRSDFGGMATEVEENLFGLMNNFKTGRNMSFRAYQQHLVEKSIKKKHPDFWEKGLREILIQKKDDFYDDPTIGKIDGMLKQYVDEADKNGFHTNLTKLKGKKRDDFVDSIFETLNVYKDKKLMNQNELRQIEKRTRDNQYKGFKKDNSRQAKSNWFTRLIENAYDVKQMTVRDALEHKRASSERGLFDVDSVRRSIKKTGEHIDYDMGKRLKALAKNDEEVMDLIVDRHLYMGKDGKILDLRAKAKGMDKFLAGIRDNTQIPFLRFNPLDLMHFSTYEAMKQAPKNYFFRRGTIDVQLSDKAETVGHPMAHNQDAAVGVLAKDYMYAGGDIFDILSGEKIKSNVYLTSARFGMFPRINAGMGNLHVQDYSNRSMLGNLFDIGAQETESIWERMASTVTKFSSPDWARNTLALHRQHYLSGGTNGLDSESTYKILHSQLDMRSTALSDDAVDYLNSYAKEAYGNADIDLTKMTDFESIMSTLGKINAGMNDPSSDVFTSTSLRRQVSEVWNQYHSNQTEFLKNKRVLSDNSPYLPAEMSVLDWTETNLVDKIDDVKRLVHQHAIQQIQSYNGASITVGGLIREGIESGSLAKSDLQDVRNLTNLTEVRKYWHDVYRRPENKDDALREFSKSLYFRQDEPNTVFERSLQESMDEFNPMYAMGPGQEPPQYFGYVGFQTMNKAKGYQWGLQNYNEMLQQGINPLQAIGKTATEILGQPFAGRHNLDKVTTATSIGYYMTERLDNALAQVGLGLSQKNRGSMQSILFNQLGRRIVLPYAGYQQAMYFDGLFGDVFSDNAADMYANMHEDVGHFKEFTGLNRIGKHVAGMLPGLEQIGSWPIFAPLKHATFGFIGDNRSGEEIHKYYESGEDPIRKGRWWGMGSNTPWYGGKVDRYEANWYRKLKSDYKFTDTMYGSENEYWANHWMPTLTHPFAPLNHFLLDTDHYEEKHKEDRPYPITGGIPALDMVPVIGPALNNTVGRILKPRVEHKDLEKHHRAYLEEINASIAAQYQAGGEGGYIQMMPAGGYNLAMETDGSGVGVGLGGGEGTVGYGYPGATGTGGGAGDGSGPASATARQQLTMINQAYESGGPVLGAGHQPFGTISSLDSLRDPDIIADLADIGTMGSVGGTIRDSFYSMSEVAGIYGFSLKSLIGFEEGGRGMVLEPSSRMTSFQRAFWDMEMGGRGGMLSEIGRRYNPRDPNKNYWNPIRNTMPDWLPGVDYFTDFQHGDPYVKIAKGEMRLPGEAYETLNQLHPDAFGEYGAFDRFKILADVAPYSKEYKSYRQIVSAMNQQGMLTPEMVDEYAEIRDQVSEKKKKYNFYDRKFDYADINKEEVTVTKVLDANTFITKEYGMMNPIKLAGVSVKSDDDEATQWLSQYIYEGAKLKIGLDADPLFRVRDDMMNTMRAVVYSSDNPEMPWFLSQKGQNINYMLANRDFGAAMGMFGGHNNVSVKHDGSATSTRALYSDDQITVGKIWETLTHDLLPGAPVVGPIFDKFLQTRSPLEHYKRQEVYGKAWRSWGDPVDGWLRPMFETLASKHPVVGAIQGAGIGWLAGRKAGNFWGPRIGAVVGGGLSTLRVFNEVINGAMSGEDDWLPDRRKKEREINEYFDKLKYVKFKGLYEKARQEAIRSEGVDVEEIIGGSEERGQGNKRERRALETAKKYLAISKKMGYGDSEAVRQQLDNVRDQLKEIDKDRPGGQIGEKGLLALRYRAEYESTLHGADPNGDMTKIFRALPAKDREYFTEFMNAAPEEREEILRLVPEDQKRFYQAKWGMKVDEPESLKHFFSEHNLPGADWKGWRADVNLESIKLKVVKNEGLELTEFGLWDDDVQRAEQSNVGAVQMTSVSSMIEVGRLHKVLRGAGLEDVSISLSTAKGENKIDLAFDIVKDRSQEMIQELNNNWGSIFG